MTKEQQAQWSLSQKSALVDALLELEQIDISEKVYRSLSPKEGDEHELATLARKISNHFKQKGDHQRSTTYDQYARDLMDAGYTLPTGKVE